MDKRTPGPWKSEVPPSSSGYCRVIYALREEGPDVFVAYVGNWMPPPAVADADARLIAAAPDLLAALVMVRDADNDCHKDGLPTIPPVARAFIDVAIAKAEGSGT